MTEDRSRILLVTTRSDDRHLGGSAMRFAMVRRALEAHGAVSVALYDDAPPDMATSDHLEAISVIRRRTRRRPGRLLVLLNFMSGWSQGLDRIIQGAWRADSPVTVGDVDLVWFFKMSTYVRWADRIPRAAAVVIDFDDLEENTRTHRRAALARVDAWGTGMLRRRLARRADVVCVCSEQDRVRAGTAAARILPNAVRLPPKDQVASLPETPDVLFVGRLDYGPNRDGVTWFVREVLPRVRAAVPGVRVRVVGPGSRHLDPAVAREIEVRDSPSSLDEHYAWARACIAPLHTGSGTRVKILEAMAHQRPVIATTLGAEGIDARPGRDLRVADDGPLGFTAACVDVLTSTEGARDIAARGRRLVESRYSPAAFEMAVQEVVAAAREHRDARRSAARLRPW